MARPKALQKISRFLYDMSRDLHAQIPMSEIIRVFRDAGYPLLDIDGTEWEGLLYGREGRVNIDIKGTKSMLVLTWYRYSSGRYEIVAYLS